jgi:hypothetical protein
VSRRVPNEKFPIIVADLQDEALIRAEFGLADTDLIQVVVYHSTTVDFIKIVLEVELVRSRYRYLLQLMVDTQVHFDEERRLLRLLEY